MSSLDDSPRRTTSRVPAWVPLAAFAGTTIALSLPLVYLARSRKSVLRKALNDSVAAPPKRSVTAAAPTTHQLRRGPSTTTTNTTNTNTNTNTNTAESTPESSTSSFASPGTGELLSAISRVDFSTAIFAGKAFAIATGLVTVGGVVLTVGVKSMMGVDDTKEFAERMRVAIQEGLPGLTSQILRAPETAEEGALEEFIEPPHHGHHLAEVEPRVSNWKWEEAEKRLQSAYREGGVPAWLQMASKELEAELQVERARRRQRRRQQRGGDQGGSEDVEEETSFS